MNEPRFLGCWRPKEDRRVLPVFVVGVLGVGAGDIQTRIEDGVLCGETEAFAQATHQDEGGKAFSPWLPCAQLPNMQGTLPGSGPLADPTSTHLLPVFPGLTPLQSHGVRGPWVRLVPSSLSKGPASTKDSN